MPHTMHFRVSSGLDHTWSIWVCLLIASKKAAARSLMGAAGSSRSNTILSSLGGPLTLHIHDYFSDPSTSKENVERGTTPI